MTTRHCSAKARWGAGHVPGSGSSVYCGVFGLDRELIPSAVEARMIGREHGSRNELQSYTLSELKAEASV